MSTAARPKSRTVKVNYLARVEGEGGLYVKVKGDRVDDVEFRIFEPPRLFEGFLEGRDWAEAPDITARICGICPVAYQMSAVHAMEQIAGVRIEGTLRDLRHLMYCGEWLESHGLHVYLLHAPDFLGYQDAIQLAADEPEVVQKGLRLKQIGNALMTLIGGREIHPINTRIGGFYSVPSRRQLRGMLEDVKWAREAAIETVALVASFTFPDFERDYEFIALRHPDEYAILDGRLVSNKGMDIPLEAFLEEVREEQVRRSTSLHALRDGRPYMVGPLARYSLNFDQLSPSARQAAKDAGIGPTCHNPFKSIIVRAVEMVHACDVAVEIIERYREPDEAHLSVAPRKGTGYGCTEAPRGICWHSYSTDANGTIQRARIIPPTAQNQRVIEEDLRQFVERNLDLSQDELQWQCEQSIRNYDPCISCSCHCIRVP